MRCAVCGKLPSERCNERTHQVHDRLWADYRSSNRRLLVDPAALRQRRIAQGLTQRDLAQRLGVNEATFQQWDSGRFRPSEATQLAWAEILR